MLNVHLRCWGGWDRPHLMAEVDASDKLLEKPQGCGFGQACLLVHSLVPVNVVCQVASCCILTHYRQVLRCQEDFSELNDMGVVEAQPLVQHLSGCYLHTAHVATAMVLLVCARTASR